MAPHSLIKAALNMKKHREKNLTGLVRHHICISLSQLENPRFLSEEAGAEYRDYSVEKYQMMCRLVTDKKYFEDNRKKVRLIEAPYEHVFFLIHFNLVLFECLIVADPRYEGPIKLEEKDYHGTVAHLLQAMSIISDGKKPDDKTIKEREQFKFICQLEKGLFRPEDMPPDLRPESPTSKKHAKSKDSDKKPTAENFYKGKPRSEFEQLLDYSSYWVNNSPKMPDYYPYEPKEYEKRQLEEQAQKNKVLQEWKWRNQPQRQAPDPLAPPGFDEKPQTEVNLTSIFDQNRIDLTSTTPLSNPNEDAVRKTYQKAAEMFQKSKEPADIVTLLRQSGLAEKIDVEECEGEDVLKMFGVKVDFNEKTVINGSTSGRLAVLQLRPISYNSNGIITNVQWDKVKISCPPKLSDTIRPPLFPWQWLEKDFKLVRKNLKELHDKADIQFLSQSKFSNKGQTFNEFFFILHAIVDVRDYQFADLVAHFQDLTTVAVTNNNKYPQLYKIYGNMRLKCIQYAREMRFHHYLSLPSYVWMNGLVDLKTIINEADFANQGQTDVKWRFELNQDALAKRKANVDDFEAPGVCFFGNYTWHHLMEVIGMYTKNAAATRLSKKKNCFLFYENHNLQLGYGSVMVHDLWDKDVRLRNKLPYGLRVTMKGVDGSSPRKQNEAAILLWNGFMTFFCGLSEAKIAPDVWFVRRMNEEKDAPAAQYGALIHEQAEKRQIGDDGSLLYQQVVQVLELAVRLHEFGKEDDKKNPIPFSLQPVDLKMHEKIITKLVGILGSEAIKMVNLSTLLFENEHHYLQLASNVAEKYGAFEVYSHGTLLKENIIIGEPVTHADGTTSRPVKHLCCFFNCQKAPVGFDLTTVIYNLIQPSYRPIVMNQLITLYTEMINKSSLGNKDLDDIQVGKLVTFFGPYAAYVSFYNSYMDNYDEFSLSSDEKVKQKIKTLWLVKCSALNDACMRYNNQKSNEEYTVTMKAKGF